MTPAAAAILEGMPDPRDLRRVSADGQTFIFAGSRQLFRYRDDDTGARNVAVAVLRQLGYSGQAVAAAGPPRRSPPAAPGYAASPRSSPSGPSPRPPPARNSPAAAAPPPPRSAPRCHHPGSGTAAGTRRR